jgi:hypothetical protein
MTVSMTIKRETSMTTSTIILGVVYAECNVLYSYAECHSVECHYAKCHSVECRYAECRGTLPVMSGLDSDRSLGATTLTITTFSITTIPIRVKKLHCL